MKFSQVIEVHPEKYIITIEQKDTDKILIKCEPKDDTITLFDYYIELSFEEFISLGKSFKQCDDINDVFILLKNVLSESEIKTSKTLYSKAELQLLDNEIIILLLKIPLLTEKYEEIKFEFAKKNKDTINQFKKLREKYQNLKKMIYEEDNSYYSKAYEFTKKLIQTFNN